VVALIGPTGSGKSDIAVAAARATGAHVVAVDAFTVYRQMTVGTAKPPPRDRAAVPHHMVDRLDVEDECTVRWFQDEARDAIGRCADRGIPVLLVGGSGLYFRAVVDPLQFPPTDPDLRARIELEVAADPAAAHAGLAASDRPAADRIDPLNVRRITRALEVAELTGRPFSSFATDWDAHQSVYPGLQVVGLQLDRDDLVVRIHRRVAAMLDAGWVEECRALADRQLSDTAAQAIGYAELLAWLDGGGGRGGGDPAALPAVAERIAIRTRQFAARQRRWFAADPRVVWRAPHDATDAVVQALQGDRPAIPGDLRSPSTAEEHDEA
jgi:tRNA dimethylallyltransferase